MTITLAAPLGLVATSEDAPGRLAALCGSLAVFNVTDPLRMRLIERLTDEGDVFEGPGLVMTGDGWPAYAYNGGRGGANAAGGFATDGSRLYMSLRSGRFLVVERSAPRGLVGQLDLLGEVTDVSVDPAQPSVAIAAVE